MYVVSSGSVIHWSGGHVVGGNPVPDAVLTEWGEQGLKANLAAHSIVESVAESVREVKRERK